MGIQFALAEPEPGVYPGRTSGCSSILKPRDKKTKVHAHVLLVI